ncbi:WbqC family protein [Ascidiimonas sp. W6]|uniref:WbqC family protein n=1 Tax=Ascidiimonas meishanensis TaxID=3128903 RepID=UPI0030EBF45B
MTPSLLHPAYFPSVASFAAIVQAETLLFEAMDNYQKQTYRNRFYIYASDGKQTLTVPIKHSRSTAKQKYKDVLIENNFNWQKQHWRTLETAYRTSPFFEFYEDEISPLFQEVHTSLYELNLKSIQLICDCMQFDLSFNRTKEYLKNYSKDLNDYRYLIHAKQPLPFELTAYTQVFGEKYGYLKNLSILDLLFNEGPQALDFLKTQKLP